MIDIQKQKESEKNRFDSRSEKAPEAQGEMDSFTLKRLSDEKLSMASATRLLNNIRLWYPQTEDIIAGVNFKNRDSVFEAVKKIRDIFL